MSLRCTEVCLPHLPPNSPLQSPLDVPRSLPTLLPRPDSPTPSTASPTATLSGRKTRGEATSNGLASRGCPSRGPSPSPASLTSCARREWSPKCLRSLNRIITAIVIMHLQGFQTMPARKSMSGILEASPVPAGTFQLPSIHDPTMIMMKRTVMCNYAYCDAGTIGRVQTVISDFQMEL